MADNLYIRFVASGALYEEGSPLHGSDQPDVLVVGPVHHFHMIYGTVRILTDDYAERHIGSLSEEDGLWHVGMRLTPVEGTVLVTPTVNPDALLFSDVGIDTEPPEEGVRVLALTDFED